MKLAKAKYINITIILDVYRFMCIYKECKYVYVRCVENKIAMRILTVHRKHHNLGTTDRTTNAHPGAFIARRSNKLTEEEIGKCIQL